MGRYRRVGYHPHARRRMRQHRVSERQIERAFEAPDRTGSSTNPPGQIMAERDTVADIDLVTIPAPPGCVTLGGPFAEVMDRASEAERVGRWRRSSRLATIGAGQLP